MSPRLLAPALCLAALVALAAGCGGLPGANDETGPGDEAGATTGVPTGGAPGCEFADDCPAPALCEAVACSDSLCVYTPRPEGERDDDDPGDCRRSVCDGAGGGNLVDDIADVPDDGNDCTLDRCSLDAEPEHVPLAAGSTCAGGYCHADLSCQPCPERDGCSDDGPDEPNETQSKAHGLAPLRDDAGFAYLCEALGSAGDVDWYTVDTIDAVLGNVDPAIATLPAGVRVCVYFQCKQGTTSVVCPEQTVAQNAPLGQQGCCGAGEFEPQIECAGFDEDATMWLMVEHTPPAADDPPLPACLNYQLGYEY